jgi:hypothetical protein
MRHSPEIIARARQMYADGALFADICKACGLSTGGLTYWIDGGPAKGERHLDPLPRRNRAMARIRRGRRTKGDRIALIARLWRTAEAQVRDIEERLMRHAQQPDDREKDARTLAVLVKTLRELSALDGADGQPETEDDGPHDIEEFRRELARRMEAVVAGRAHRVPGEAQGE